MSIAQLLPLPSDSKQERDQNNQMKPRNGSLVYEIEFNSRTEYIKADSILQNDYTYLGSPAASWGRGGMPLCTHSYNMLQFYMLTFKLKINLGICY